MNEGVADPAEDAEKFWTGLFADLLGAVLHESTNFLNVVLLQTAVLELELSETSLDQLQRIRRQGAAFKNLLIELQSYREQEPLTVGPVDINHAVEEVVGKLPGYRLLARRFAPRGPNSPPRVQIDLVPGADLPPVLAAPPLLERLLIFLFLSANDGSGLTVRTEENAEHVRLRVTRKGVAGPGPVWDEASLAGVACQSLAHRLRGRIRNDAGEAVVDLPRAAAR